MASENELSVPKTLAVINELGLRVSQADLASATGASLFDVQRRLNEIAARTGAVLEVSEAGQITYCFKPGFQNAYVLSGYAAVVQDSLFALGQAAFFLLRISFGVMLVLSILIVILFFVVIIVAALFNDNSGGGDLSLGDGWFDISPIGDAFNWNYTINHDRRIEKYGVPAKHTRLKEQVKKGNFLLECFSFLFGDGDPNYNLEERRWDYIAQTIKANNYLVVQEQLAPYLDPELNPEAGVLKVLQRFNGSPEVTESGNIVYVFESLRGAHLNKQPEKLEPFLEERKLEFSAYPASSLFFVFMLALINFAGSWWLFRHVATIHLLHDFVYLIDFLLAYGILFLLLPACRLLVNAVINGGIEMRNQWRLSQAEELHPPKLELKKKLEEAKWLAGTMVKAPQNKLTYTTSKDLLEQLTERFDKQEEP
ncbi:MAG: hypothetical protein K2W82_07980 [Candidatus Obscuribacterales bacterium]|nr:hypothetical protein [Candidatus Obscuribacterales bacterium]